MPKPIKMAALRKGHAPLHREASIAMLTISAPGLFTAET